MSTRAITIGIAVIILAALAYYVGMNRTAPSDAEANATSTPQTQTDTKATETQSQVVGTWKSDDDAKYTRTFRADGTVSDSYQGDANASASGTWKVFTSLSAPAVSVTFPIEASAAYVQVQMDGETYNYRVASVSSTKLELVYMDRGGMLRFTKVQ